MVATVTTLKTPELERDPHIVLPTIDGNVHVIPVVVLEGYVAGVSFEDPESLVVRTIVSEWLNKLGASSAPQADPEERGPAPDNVLEFKR
jgi:hypothetical protein